MHGHRQSVGEGVQKRRVPCPVAAGDAAPNSFWESNTTAAVPKGARVEKLRDALQGLTEVPAIGTHMQ